MTREELAYDEYVQLIKDTGQEPLSLEQWQAVTNIHEPNFDYQELDSNINVPDLLRWVADNSLVGIVDEEKGGIIGYIHRDHAERIINILNNKN